MKTRNRLGLIGVVASAILYFSAGVLYALIQNPATETAATGAENEPSELQELPFANQTDGSIPTGSVIEGPTATYDYSVFGSTQESTTQPERQDSETLATSTATTGTETTVTDTTGTTQPVTQPSTSDTPIPSTTDSTVEQATTCAAGADFELVMRDDFNGPQIANHWVQYNGAGHDNNGKRDSAALSIEEGKLVITAANDGNGQIVSGGLGHSYSQTYGMYRARVRTDADPGESTSGVLLTWPASNKHDEHGENDYYETQTSPGDRSEPKAFIHKPVQDPNTPGTEQTMFTYTGDATQWQEVTMQWRPDGITLYRQGPGSATADRFELAETSEDLIPDNPHFAAIQLDAFKTSVEGTVRMEVDWIEVHKLCR